MHAKVILNNQATSFTMPVAPVVIPDEPVVVLRRMIFVEYTNRYGNVVRYWRKAHINSKAFAYFTKMFLGDEQIIVPMEHKHKYYAPVRNVTNIRHPKNHLKCNLAGV